MLHSPMSLEALSPTTEEKSLHVDFIFKAYKADESMKRKTGHVHSCLYSRLGMLQKPIVA